MKYYLLLLLLLIPLVNAEIYQDCTVYGNCKPITSGGTTFNNNTFGSNFTEVDPIYNAQKPSYVNFWINWTQISDNLYASISSLVTSSNNLQTNISNVNTSLINRIGNLTLGTLTSPIQKNAITFTNDSGSQVNNNLSLMWNNANNRLSIGANTSSDAPLVVTGTTASYGGAVRIYSATAGTGATNIDLVISDTNGSSAGGHTGLSISRTAATNGNINIDAYKSGVGGTTLNLNTLNNGALTVGTGGTTFNSNVGIGTAPVSGLRLDLSGGALRVADTGIFSGHTNFPTSTGPAAEIGYYSTGGYAFFHGYNRAGSAYIPFQLESSTVSFYADGNTAKGMKLDNAGNLGIRTNIPREKLDVNGSVIINQNLNVTGNISASVYTSESKIGLNATYQIVCDVDLIGITKKYQNFTYTNGIMTTAGVCQ